MVPPPRISIDDGARIPDWLWSRIGPMLPPPPPDPRGHRKPRLPDRRVLDAILLVMRSQARWADLEPTGLCSRPTANRRSAEWSAAGVFASLRALGIAELDVLAGTWQGPARRTRGPGRPRAASPPE
jgi:transposase